MQMAELRLARDPYHLPDALLQRILADDAEVAADLYGSNTCMLQPHHLPAVVTCQSTKRQWHAVLLTAEDGSRRVRGRKVTTPCFVLHGPTGSDLPLTAAGDKNSNGTVPQTVSSTATRFAANSSYNGWHMVTQNADKVRLKVLRPSQNGEGFMNYSPPRLRWLCRTWKAIAALPPSVARTSFVGDPPTDIDTLPVPAACTHADAEVRAGWALVDYLIHKSRPNADADMRERTAEHPRQYFRSSRKRDSRNIFGTRISPDGKRVNFKGRYRYAKRGPERGLLSFHCDFPPQRDMECMVPAMDFASCVASRRDVDRALLLVLKDICERPEEFLM